MLEKSKRMTHVRTVTDPKTLRPSFVSVETVISVKVKGEHEGRQVEKHEYRFDWK